MSFPKTKQTTKLIEEQRFKLRNSLNCLKTINQLALMEDIAYLLIRGGWPDSIGLSEKAVIGKNEDYINTITHIEVTNGDGIKKSPEKVKAFLRSLARGTSSQTSLQSIIEDSKIDDKTAAKYRDALEKIYIVEDLLAWTPSLRSKIAIRTKPTRCFVDPSIPASCLGATSTNLLNDFRTFGLLFESLCIRDLRVYAQCLGAKVSHFRNAKGLEADAIIHKDDGSWAAIEIKLGLDKIEEAAKNLLKIKNMSFNPPRFLMIITSVGTAYQREDGVYVVPIGCLRN